MSKIKIGILGYGNLGQGVELGVQHAEDMELVGIFSRRQPDQLDTSSPAFHVDQLESMKDEIDVLILCGSSDKDLPEHGPYYAQYFNTVDSFDTHNDIPIYFEKVNQSAEKGSHVAVISSGWDPGLFSLNRLISEAILPQGETYTFWGPGKSQGHGAAVRQVEGVKDAVQYTIPSQKLLDKINQGHSIEYTSTTAHDREVYAVLEEGADSDQVEQAIVNMENYFKGYDTQVHFISQEELDRDHAGLPHGGRVIRQGYTDKEHQSLYEFGLSLDSNPEFTAAVNVACARAAHRMAGRGVSGAQTIFDIPPALLSPKSPEELRKELL